ncbi:MAG: hypothetical protein HQL31_09095 [Planctomycetes bacterium]|nr:hypothetical protein [Planctomycetota bacterium]
MAKSGNKSPGWKANPLVGMISFLVIVFCILYMFCSGDNTRSRIRDVHLDVICTECGFQGREAGLAVLPPPYTCPKCEKKSLLQARKCADCGKVTPASYPLVDYSCKDCEYHGELRLDPMASPHECPECKKKSLFPSYECSCGEIFPFEMKSPNPDPESPDMMPPMMYLDPFMPVLCPACGKQEATPLTKEMENTCYHCNSRNLVEITPSAVVKKELGLRLSENDKKVIGEWESKK